MKYTICRVEHCENYSNSPETPYRYTVDAESYTYISIVDIMKVLDNLEKEAREKEE